MTAQAHTTGQSVAASQNWYSRTPAQVTADLGVDPAVDDATILPYCVASDATARHDPDQPAPVRLGPDPGYRPPAAVGTRQVRGATPTRNNPGHERFRN